MKVQYPDTEKFFRMDFDVILRIFQAVNPELVDALEIQRKCFAQEFDYKTEAANLRFTYDTVRPAFAHLDVPQPYDARHPSYPAELRDLTNPPEEVFAVVKLHYGGSAGIAEGLRTFGFESLADAMGPKMSELFEIASFNAEYAMVQRLGFCLNGVGQNLGTRAGSLRRSCSRRRPPPSFGDGACRERTTRRNPWRRRLPNRRGHASRVGKRKLGRRKRGARRRPRLPRRACPKRRAP